MGAKLCQCHSGQPYAKCCGPLHKGEPPATALMLMRSRYCAYARGNVEYIIATTHKDNALFKLPDALRRQQVKMFCDNTDFRGLDILDFVDGQNESTVTFRAIIFQDGQNCSFVEKSLFKKVGNFWKYYGIDNE